MRFPSKFLVLVAVLLVPATGFAQALTGEVTDNTGGILPGVTVEASSEALIEGTRVGITDGTGRYTIAGLSTGIYTLTMTLPGFSTFIQEEINVPAGTTVTADGQLAVGGIEETVTVSGESPVVDVQQATRTQVLSREVLDNVVNTGSPWTQAMMVPGVSMMGPDVGGSRYVNDLQLESRGANAKHTTVMQDGMSLNLAALEGVPVMYNQDLAAQEMAVTTGGGGGSAEHQAGGVVLNIIPKDGGNVFSGTGYIGHTASGWMADNYNDKLKAMGVGKLGKLSKIFDYAGAVGGPIIRDRLWFHESVRWWGAYTPIPDRLYDDGSIFTNEEDIISNVIRFTAQANPTNKISIFLDRLNKRRGPVVAAVYPAVLVPGQRGPDPETAINYQNKGQGWHHAPYWQGQLKWTSTVSNRLLVEAGYTNVGVADCCSDPMPGSQFTRGSADWYKYVRKNDLDLSTQWDSVEDFTWNLPAQRYMAALTYVTGSHNVKMGFTNGWGTAEQHRFANGDLQEIRLRSGVPLSVGVRNYPWMRMNEVKSEAAFYIQDAWTVDRLTISAGIRADFLNARVPAQVVPAGRFIAARNFAAIENIPDWGPDFAPRFGIAWDIFGDARTALKFSTGKYFTPTTTALPNKVNPMALQTYWVPWNDADYGGAVLPTNGNMIAEDNEINKAYLPTGFGTRRVDSIDPNLTREYNVENSISIEREIASGVSASVGFYRRSFHNIITNDKGYEGLYSRDRSLSLSDWRTVSVVSPMNGEVFDVYDIKNIASLGDVDNLITNPSGHRRVYTGIEYSLNARLPGGGNVITSLTTQRTITNECDVTDNPNELRFCDRFNIPALYNGVNFKNEFKFAAYYPLPYEMQASIVFNSVTGRPTSDIQRVDELLPINWLIDRNTTYTAAQCAGKPCTAGAKVIPDMIMSSLTTPLAPSGTEHVLPRLNMVNISVKKTLNAGGLQYEPQFEVYNLTNSSIHYSERSANYGTSSYGVPNQVLLGRMIRLSVQLQW